MMINGVLKATPCDRSSIGSVVRKMLLSKKADLRESPLEGLHLHSAFYAGARVRRNGGSGTGDVSR